MKVSLFYTCTHEDSHNQSGTPMGLAYLAGALASKQGITDIDIVVDENYLIQSKPDIVGISSYSGTYTRSIKIAREIKQHLDIPIILGGTHISVLPQTLDSVFDAGVIGEGEETFADLVGLYRDGQWSRDALAQVPGIVYPARAGELQYTQPRELLMVLDEIPRPRRDVLRPYWPELHRYIQWPQVLFTSRGCPYRCMFCIHSGARQKIRYHSPERVISEIYEILEHYPDQKSISIFDDLFAINKHRLETIVNMIRAEKLHHRVSFISHAKSSCFDEDIAHLLKLMNSSMVIFGFESGSDRIVKYLKGRSASAVKNQEAIDLCRKYSLNVGGYFIIGSPCETYQELAKTYWFIRQNVPPVRASGAFFLTPLPGTVYWEEALKEGRVDNQMEDWSILDFTDMEKWRCQMFVNQHYSFDDLMFANQKFEEIKKINYLLPMMNIWDQVRYAYQNQLYEKVASYLPQQIQLLEISPDVDHFGQYVSEFYQQSDWTITSQLFGEEISLKNESAVFLNQVLERTRSPEHLLRSFSQAETLLISTSNIGYIAYLVQLLKGTFCSESSPALQGHVRFFTPQMLQALLTRMGYGIVALERIHGDPQREYAPITQLLQEVCRALGISERSLQELQTFGLLIVARKTGALSQGA